MKLRHGRMRWLLGVCAAWSLAWMVLGVQTFQRMSASPHPFLRDQKINHVLVRAIVDWTAQSLLEHLGFGLITGLIVLTFFAFRSGGRTDSILTFRGGLAVGGACILFAHAVLYLMVPGAITTVSGLNRLPMGPLLLALFLGAFWLLRKTFRLFPAPFLRTAASLLAVLLLFLLPHDLFRRHLHGPRNLEKNDPRLLIVGIDALRADVFARLAPDWEVPNQAQAICAIPATRVAWHMLLGGDPATYSVAEVIPFRSEFLDKSPLVLIDRMRTAGIRSAFIIDDSTTLSFGLKPNRFSEVVEPDGGWKHYFSVGFGATWPLHSWVENHFSPVETTNPWSDVDAYFKDVGRVLGRNQFVASHCVQLHVPQYLNLAEIQTLRPWHWLLHASYSYEAYHSGAQAKADGFARQGGRANPVNHYRIRAGRILASLRRSIEAWQLAYPNLSGVVTSDHGERHPPLFNGGEVNVGFLTGIHGYSLDPDTVRVPMHPFGRTRVLLRPRQVYSWFDLRDAIGEWISHPEALEMKSAEPQGWLVQSPTVQATHLMAPEFQVKGIDGAGLTPDAIARSTTTNIDGIWYLDDPDPASSERPVMSSALVSSEGMVTFNPVSRTTWLRQVWKGYELAESAQVSTTAAEAEISAFPGKRPLAIGS